MWRWVRNLFRIVSGLPNFLKVYRSQGWRKNPVSQSEKDRHRNTAGTSYWYTGTPPPPRCIFRNLLECWHSRHRLWLTFSLSGPGPDWSRPERGPSREAPVPGCEYDTFQFGALEILNTGTTGLVPYELYRSREKINIFFPIFNTVPVRWIGHPVDDKLLLLD